MAWCMLLLKMLSLLGQPRAEPCTAGWAGVPEAPASQCPARDHKHVMTAQQRVRAMSFNMSRHVSMACCCLRCSYCASGLMLRHASRARQAT